MATQSKLVIAMGAVTLLSFAANYAAFVLCYNYLATPYLEIEQQEMNAGFILGGALALFAAAALVTGIAGYLASKARKPPEKDDAPMAEG
jgi:hypothetical protein